MDFFSDEYFMREALKEARRAMEAREIPVGAIMVANQRIIAKAHNQTEQLTDSTAHAEMIAITSAANFLGSKYLSDCTLFVTLEPCVMCAGALYWSQLGRLVYGASDLQRGFTRVSGQVLHPRTEVTKGICATQSEELITSFFKSLRDKPS